jgi:hypothetical protein
LEGIPQHYTTFLVPIGPLELAAGPSCPARASRPLVTHGACNIDPSTIEALRNFTIARKHLTPNETNPEFYVFPVPFAVNRTSGPLALSKLSW